MYNVTLEYFRSHSESSLWMCVCESTRLWCSWLQSFIVSVILLPVEAVRGSVRPGWLCSNCRVFGSGCLVIKDQS